LHYLPSYIKQYSSLHIVIIIITFNCSHCSDNSFFSTSGQSNLTKKNASPPHMEGSVVFARWRQCDKISRRTHSRPTAVPGPHSAREGATLVNASAYRHRLGVTLTLNLTLTPTQPYGPLGISAYVADTLIR